MQDREFAHRTRLILILMAAAFGLGGCLMDEAPVESGDAPQDPGGNSAPVISGNPPTAVQVGNTYSFRPNAIDADGDTLTFSIVNMPGWAEFDTATGELSGQPMMGNEGVYANIQITVSDGTAQDQLPVFSISVDQMGNFSTTLSWTAPTQNEDGSQLMDLAGYKIYWGTSPGNYTNSVTVENPGITTYVVENLSAGTYTFVATSYNDSGVESVYSNTATRTFQ